MVTNLAGIVSNLGALRDEKHEHDELRQEQLTELENQFELKVSPVASLYFYLFVCSLFWISQKLPALFLQDRLSTKHVVNLFLIHLV
jgi:hypothetical protein